MVSYCVPCVGQQRVITSWRNRQRKILHRMCVYTGHTHRLRPLSWGVWRPWTSRRVLLSGPLPGSGSPTLNRASRPRQNSWKRSQFGLSASSLTNKGKIEGRLRGEKVEREGERGEKYKERVREMGNSERENCSRPDGVVFWQTGSQRNPGTSRKPSLPFQAPAGPMKPLPAISCTTTVTETF